MLRKAMLASALCCAAVPAQAATVVAAGTPGTTGVTGLYPTILAANTTGVGDATYTGAPDDIYLGVGGQTVTFDFGDFRLLDAAGQDFNVYEVDFGVPELNLVDVLVSSDNLTFVSVLASSAGAIDLAGDEAHGDASYRYSFDLGAATLAGITDIRYVQIEGDGTGSAGFQTGFDLDAIGAANFRQIASAVPEPATWAMMLIGFAGIGLSFRRGRKTGPALAA